MVKYLSCKLGGRHTPKASQDLDKQDLPALDVRFQGDHVAKKLEAAAKESAPHNFTVDMP